MGRRMVGWRRALYWVVVCALLLGGIALRAPALHANLYADDWDHYAIEKGIYPVQIASWDMFRWVGNGVSERDTLLRAGRLPWWSSRDLKLSVLRPLASVLAHFDYATLDGANHPDRLHLHTVFWWGLLLLGLASLMQQIVPWPVALLTTLIYAVDDCFIMPFAWVANRSEIIALAFSVWALSFHIRALHSGSLRMRCAVAVLVFLSFCAGEHAFAPLAFIVAATLASPGTLWARMRTLLPLGLIVALYIIVRAALKYGVASSGFYIDPLAEPLRYLQACATRIPILLAELVFSIPCEMSQGAPLPTGTFLGSLLRSLSGSSANFVGVGVVAGLLSIAGVAWLRSHGERAIAWLVFGALLALLPLGGTIASGRLTAAPAIGFDALLAYLLWKSGSAVVQASQNWLRVLALTLAVLLISLALVVPVRRSYDGAHYMNGMTNGERFWIQGADFGVDRLAGRHVYVLSARDLASETSIPFILHAQGRALPASATLLSPRGDSAQTLVRVADNAFELALGPTRPRKFNGSVYRADDDVMHPGERFRATGFEVTVIETSHDQPSVLRFQFLTSLDDDNAVFMVAAKGRCTRFIMPKIGERVVIPPAEWP